MDTRDILAALRDKNYRTANEQFSRVMASKLASALAAERTDVAKTLFVAESMMPTQEVQRVFDETGSASETEILCGVRDLKVTDQGQVVSFVSEAFVHPAVNGMALSQASKDAWAKKEKPAPKTEGVDEGVCPKCGHPWVQHDELQSKNLHTLVQRLREREASEPASRRAEWTAARGAAHAALADNPWGCPERNNLEEGTKYHMCPDCERSFSDKELVDGKLPEHKFLGKPCAASGTLKEDVSRPNTSGQGYDDDYMNNPYHGIIRKYGYQYSHSTPVTVNGVKGIRHTYKQDGPKGTHYVGVFGNSWSTSATDGVARPSYGSHPNTTRCGADLERHLLDKARRYDLTEDNKETFRTELEKQYTDLFANDAEYAYSASKIKADALAAKMTDALAKGSGNKDGKGVKNTCKALGIAYTYTAIRAFLAEESDYTIPRPKWMSAPKYKAGDRVKPSDMSLEKDRDYLMKLGRNHPNYSTFQDALKKRASRRGTVLACGYNGHAMGCSVKWDDGGNSECMEHMVMPVEKARMNITEAFGQSFDILPGVDEDTKEAVEKVNTILDAAQDMYNDEEAATRFKDQPNWKERVAGFKHSLRMKVKSKYILLDRVDANGTSASGCMMVDRTDGRIYGTKAYGVVNKLHTFGTAAEPKIKDMAMKASVLERAVIARHF